MVENGDAEGYQTNGSPIVLTIALGDCALTAARLENRSISDHYSNLGNTPGATQDPVTENGP